ncbi:unnamed protein product, partial [Closterium sp. NIES-54]
MVLCDVVCYPGTSTPFFPFFASFPSFPSFPSSPASPYSPSSPSFPPLPLSLSPLVSSAPSYLSSYPLGPGLLEMLPGLPPLLSLLIHRIC